MSSIFYASELNGRFEECFVGFSCRNFIIIAQFSVLGKTVSRGNLVRGHFGNHKNTQNNKCRNHLDILKPKLKPKQTNNQAVHILTLHSSISKLAVAMSISCTSTHRNFNNQLLLTKFQHRKMCATIYLLSNYDKSDFLFR